MASFRETLHLLIDIDSSGATTGVGKLRSELANTDGAFNKMRVGATGAFDLVKQHAATAALAAGTAIVGFAVKAVGDFQEVALGAGQLRDSLGLTAEEASRLQEVGADLGISTSALESTIGRMNRTAAESPAKFDEIGASIKRNADGTVNVNETFLSTVDALNKIPDATKRASAAQEIFGRSWQDIAEMVGLGADGVREALESVEDAKVIDDGEIAKARKFRDTMDDLRGMAESASLALGETLVPVLDTVADALITAKGAVERFQGALPDAAEEAGFDIFSTGGGIIEDFRHNWEVLDDTIRGSGIDASVADVAESVEGLDAEVTQATRSTAGMNNIVDESTVALDGQSDAADDARASQKALREETFRLAGGTFDLEKAQLQLADAVDQMAAANEAAAAVGADAAATDRDKAAAVREVRGATIDAAEQAYHAAEAYAHEAGAQNGSAQQAQLMTQYLRGLQNQFPGLRAEIQAYIDKLNAIPETRTTNLIVRTSTTTASGAPSRNFLKPEEQVAGGRAAGGPVRAGEPYLVGEDGPEVIVPNSNGTVIPNGRGGPAGGVTFNIHAPITAGMGANGTAIARDFKNAMAATVRTEGADSIRRLLGL